MPRESSESRDPFAAVKETAAIGRDKLRAIRLKLRLEKMLARSRRSARPSKRDAEANLKELLQAVMECCDAPMGNIQMVEDANSLRLRAWSGFDEKFVSYFEIVTERTACHRAFGEAKPVVIEDVAGSPVFTPAARRVLLEAHARAVQSVALRRGKETLGVISVHYPEPRIPTARRDALATLAPLIAEVVAVCES